MFYSRHHYLQYVCISTIVSEAQKCPKEKCPFCPRGDPWGTPLHLEIRHVWAPVRPPRGQTLRSPRPKVTSVLTRHSSITLGAKYCTPEINTSEVFVDFSGIFQRNVTCQWYFPKDCHLPSGFLLEFANGLSMAFPH